MEDKQEICNLLLKTLQKTRNCYDLLNLNLTYKKENDLEFVIIEFEGGSRKANITFDSGTAMIRDIMASLGC